MFVHFISSPGHQALSFAVKSKWKELLLDYSGVTCGAAVQSKPGDPILTAIKSLGSGGSNTVFCRGCSVTPPFTALSE
jgi:hypothetical protein